MADDKKSRRIPFPVEVTVNGIKVTVTLMLKPGTTVSVVENEQHETKEDQPQGKPKSRSCRCTFELRYGMPDAVYGGIGLFLMTGQVAVSLSIAANGASLVKLFE